MQLHTLDAITMNPILEGLKKGEKYPFRLLCYEQEAINEYWEWWWKNRFDGSLVRPHTVEDGDPILEVTSGKTQVDTLTDDVFFPSALTKALEAGALPSGCTLDRADYRERLAEYLTRFCPPQGEPTVVFTGGGYGSGKTVTMQFLIMHDYLKCGFGLDALVGVDYCKQMLPEFNLLKSVSDGRASELTQGESRIISELMFSRLVSGKRSFGWDSSMSHYDETVKKIQDAKGHGYNTAFVAILTRLDIAQKRAMQRAFDTKRFPPPKYLNSSHSQFIEHLPKYVPLFDKVWVVENSEESGSESAQRIIARKLSRGDSLEILDDKLYFSYVSKVH